MLIIDGNTRKLILKDLQVNTFNDEKGNFVAHCGKYLDVPFFITRNLVIFADKFYPKSYTINDKKYTIFFNAPDKPFFVKLVEFHCTDEKISRHALVFQDKSILYKNDLSCKIDYRCDTNDIEEDIYSTNEQMLASIKVSEFNCTTSFTYQSNTNDILEEQKFTKSENVRSYFEEQEVNASRLQQLNVLAEHFLGADYNRIVKA